MDTIQMLGWFVTVVGIAVVVVGLVIVTGMVTAITLLVKNAKSPQKGKRPRTTYHRTPSSRNA
ncbi:MAG: hypothetical protein H8D34_26265 [Chloroflexi bacterium]|nr:hypothetical protein [Chloroflexota bacterium]